MSRYDRPAAACVEIASRSKQIVAGNFLLALTHDFYTSGCEPIVVARRNKSARRVSSLLLPSPLLLLLLLLLSVSPAEMGFYRPNQQCQR